MVSLLHYPLAISPSPRAGAHSTINSEGSCVFAFALEGEAAQQLLSSTIDTLQHYQLSSGLELHQALGKLIAQVEAQATSIQVAAFARQDQKVFLATYHGLIWLKRDAKLRPLLSQSDELQFVEGTWKEKDIFVLGTESLFPLQTEIEGLFAVTQPAEELGSELQKVFTDHQSHRAVAMSVISFGQPSASVSSQTMLLPGHPKAAAGPQVSAAVLGQKLRWLVKGLRHHLQVLSHVPRKLFTQDVYVRQQHNKKLLKLLVPVVIAVALLIGVVLFQQNRRQAQLRQASAILAPYRQTLQTLKQQADQNPPQTRQQTEDLITQLEATVAQQQNTPLIRDAVAAQLAETRDFYQSISGKQEVNVLPQFFNLLLAQSDFIANEFDLHQKTMVFLDSAKNTLLALDVETKQFTVLPVGELKQIKDLSFLDKNLVLLSEGIFATNLDGKNPPQLVRSAEDENKSATMVKAYDKFVYILNKEKLALYKYTVEDDGKLSSPSSWFHSDQQIDIPSIYSLAIDGDVWLGFQNGQLQKFSGGQKQDFSVTGLSESFSTPIVVYTSASVENLYVLEPQKSRLVILSKKGEFLREIKSESFAATTAVVADEQLKKAFVLSGSMVFEVGL